MRLQRVQVPDFRVLKNIDISFEKDFVPNIFPIGSQNGGGKSTLLQLIFVLLHCSIASERKKFIKNLLFGFNIHQESSHRILAIIEIWNGKNLVELEFLSTKNSHHQTNDNFSIFQDINEVELIKNAMSNKKAEIIKLQESLKQLESIIYIDSKKEKDYQITAIANNLNFYKIQSDKNNSPEIDINSLILNIIAKISSSKSELIKLEEKLKELDKKTLPLLKQLQSENLFYICNYSSEDDNDDKVLLCKIKNIEMDEAELFLKEISEKVFLAVPNTQIFLFSPHELRSLLFREQKNDYYSLITTMKSALTGLFTYDFLAVNLLVEAFKKSRDQDFREAVDNGEYGNSYKKLINNLNSLLIEKRIKLDADFSGVTFQAHRDGKDIQLNPEDLSHGELKRLSIYMWIKSQNIEDAIVLMDEIEIAFHPDWQYQIISDLYQWSPTNQYILATHSYELCQALTPAHVKELDPKLLKPETKSQL